MSTESARKAAEAVNETTDKLCTILGIPDGAHRSLITVALTEMAQLIAAAFQTVAPPPDIRQKCVNFLCRWPNPSVDELRDFVVSLGAAPAVSTPPASESEVMPTADSDRHTQSELPATSASLKTSGLAVSSPLPDQSMPPWSERSNRWLVVDKGGIPEDSELCRELMRRLAAVSTPRCPVCNNDKSRLQSIQHDLSRAWAVCDQCGQTYPLITWADFAQFFQPAPSPWISAANPPKFTREIKKDRLHYSDEVLAFDADGSGAIIQATYNQFEGKEPKWVADHAGQELKNVTHWQPLPVSPVVPSPEGESR